MRRVMALVRHALGRGLLPKKFAGGAIKAEDQKLVEIGRRAGLLLELGVGLGQFIRSRNSIRFDGREDKNPIAPNDRTGAAAAREWSFPSDVVLFVPGNRGIGFGVVFVGARPPPGVSVCY